MRVAVTTTPTTVETVADRPYHCRNLGEVRVWFDLGEDPAETGSYLDPGEVTVLGGIREYSFATESDTSELGIVEVAA